MVKIGESNRKITQSKTKQWIYLILTLDCRDRLRKYGSFKAFGLHIHWGYGQNAALANTFTDDFASVAENLLVLRMGKVY